MNIDKFSGCQSIEIIRDVNISFWQTDYRLLKSGFEMLIYKYKRSSHFLEYSHRNSLSNLKQHYLAALGLGALLSSLT